MPDFPSIEGVDVPEGIRRFGGNSALYFRFLARFAEDSTMQLLQNAFSSGDYASAFQHAHTLKGLSAQLSIHALFSSCCALCDQLRSGMPENPVQAKAVFEQITAAYEKLLAQLSTLP